MHHADHVGPGGEKLSELQIGGPEPRQRARQPRTGFGAGAFDQPGQPQCQLSGRRHQARIDHAEHALAREHETGAGKPRDMGDAEITNASPNAMPRCRRKDFAS